jgi:signal transduction histidine kinase
VDCQVGEAVVSVQDTGVGIARDALDSVFEMVPQVHADDGGSNAGLGTSLFLVRALVRLHGGSVSAWSEGLRTGSIFTVRLPIIQSLTVPGPPAVN